jgi:hypothetical protein
MITSASIPTSREPCFLLRGEAVRLSAETTKIVRRTVLLNVSGEDDVRSAGQIDKLMCLSTQMPTMPARVEIDTTAVYLQEFRQDCQEIKTVFY